MAQRYRQGTNRSTLAETCGSATSSNANPTGTDLGSNPGIRDARPLTDSLSHGTALALRLQRWAQLLIGNSRHTKSVGDLVKCTWRRFRCPHRLRSAAEWNSITHPPYHHRAGWWTLLACCTRSAVLCFFVCLCSITSDKLFHTVVLRYLATVTAVLIRLWCRVDWYLVTGVSE
jgi:hypothetical protein